MANKIFNLNDVVEVVYDSYEIGGGCGYVGVKGIIKDVKVNPENNTVYGLKITEGNEIIDDVEDASNFIFYFLGVELELVEQ